jgi:predicted alpha-1,2-mannosidase
LKLSKLVLLFTIVLTFQSCTDSEKKDYSLLVNPFIGTVGSGNTFLGPVMPYGMVQLGPYSRYAEAMNSGTIYGFSHTHVSGMAGGGNTAAGKVNFMPVILDEQIGKSDASNKKQTYQSHFEHHNEIASPGYYSVILDDYNINVELTSTTRVGFHRYKFPKSNQTAVVLKLGKGSLTVKNNEISGWDNGVFFVAEFSKPFKGLEIINNDLLVETNSIAGENIKGIFRFKTKENEVMLLKVGISMVSIEGARNNLKEELPGWDFDETLKNAKKVWNKELGKIDVEGGTKTEQIIFYTALYHAMIHPNIYMDVDKKFRSTNGEIYTATDFDNYTNFSLWDTFRALHPLYTLINREMTSQFVRSFLERYDHNGRMLIMEFEGVEGEQPPMIGYHSLSVLADAYVKGIRDYDVPKAYKAAKNLANDLDRKGKRLYLDYGFIPSDLKGQNVSRTLEYCYDDWCVTRLAKDFNDDDLLYFSQRGDFYKYSFSKKENFMIGRKSNFQFISDFDPMETTGHYTEANAYQYSTFVPQDINGLVDLMGGEQNFEKWLDNCFTIQTDFSKINVRDVTGLIGQYAHGNEPSHSIAYLYNYVGTPWKTQKLVRQILSTLYANKQNGIDGNEDAGQMSAWYVMSAMGIYSVSPGMDYYVIGSPLFDKVTLNLENGNKFEIIAENNGKDNVYIQSAKLNSKSYSKTYIRDETIMNGGKLVFEMGNKPNTNWGANEEDRPYSVTEKIAYAKTPKVDFSDIMFLNSRIITLAGNEPNAKIYYTLDGTEPTEESTPYIKPITITKTSVFKTRSFVDGIAPSYPLTVHFKKIEMLEAVNVSGMKSGITFKYREGRGVMSARDQEAALILETGILKTFNVDAIKDDRPFGYQLEGYIKVPETGVYTFYLEANDGAILYLNNKEIIDNDGGHRAQRLDTKIGLKKGWHPIKVEFFQQGLANSLLVIWEGPGVEKQEILEEVLFH